MTVVFVADNTPYCNFVGSARKFHHPGDYSVSICNLSHRVFVCLFVCLVGCGIASV